MPYLYTLVGVPAEREPGNPVRKKPGASIQAKTVGEAVSAAERLLVVRIIPHDPPKWFRLFVLPEEEKFRLVDIHIMRGVENICPKQDLAFPLEEEDIVAIGALAC